MTEAKTRPGGRTARTTAAVHDAVRVLVREAVDPLSMAQVARRAGVNPTTLYRRWGSLETLLLEVAVDELNERSDVRSTGDLRTDLEAYGNGVVDGIRGPGGLRFLHAITASTASSPDGAHETLALVGRRLDRLGAMLTHSEPDGVLTPLDVVDGLVGPLYFRALVGGSDAVSRADVVRMTDNLLAVVDHRRRTGTRFAASPGPV